MKVIEHGRLIIRRRHAHVPILYLAAHSPTPAPDRNKSLHTAEQPRRSAPREVIPHIPVRTDFYGPGVHDWPYWQRDLRRSLSLLLAAIGAAA